MGSKTIPTRIRIYDQADPDGYLSPFAIDYEALRSPTRTANGRSRWRRAVLAVTRRIILENGYNSFSVKSLAQEVNSTPQTLYNNIGSKDQIISEAVVECKQWWLDLVASSDPELDAFQISVISRYLFSVHYPDFSKLLIRCLQENNYVMKSLEARFLRSVFPYAQNVIGESGRDAHNKAMLLTKLLKEVTRVTGFDWVSGNCSTEDMMTDALDGGKWCLQGASSSRGKTKHSLLLEEKIDQHMVQTR